MAKLGDMVTYYLTQADVTKITTRRLDGDSVEAMPAGFVHGLLRYGGNPVVVGQAVPAIIVAKPTSTTYNVRLFLDGQDGLWVQGVPATTSPGTLGSILLSLLTLL